MRQSKVRSTKLRLSLIIFFICLLFTFVAWDHYFNSENPLDQTLVSNLILGMGTLFSVCAGFLVWTLESGKSFLESEVVRRTEEVIEKEKQTAAAHARMNEAEKKQKEIEEAYQRLKEVQAQLIQKEKLVSIGRVVAGIVHELKNPLVTLQGYLDLVVESAKDEDLLKNLQVIERQTGRCKKVVQDLLMYSRQEKLQFSKVDLIRTLSKVLQDLQPEWLHSEIQIEFKHSESQLVIEADEEQLERVFLNILMNAGQALQKSPPPRELKIKVIQALGVIQILIIDNGPGIQKEHLEQIFDPFFTTKPAGQGTGLGLSLCQGIVGMHGGRISVQSEPNHGTVFLIELPVSQKTVLKELLQKKRKIMIVDDEKNVCSFVAKLLESWGYDVVAENEGESAFRTIMDSSQAPDLLILDVSIPDMNGFDIARKIKQKRPQIPVIFLTAKNLGFDEKEAQAAGGSAFLFKPFDYEQLKECVDRFSQSS